MAFHKEAWEGVKDIGGGLLGAARFLYDPIGALEPAISGTFEAGQEFLTGEKALTAQVDAANRADAIQVAQFAQQKALLEPFVAGSGTAFEKQQAFSGSLGPEAQKEAFAQYRESPGVAFQREQGLRGLEQGLASRGIGGGSRLKAISEFNQNLALQDFQNQFNRLGDVSDIGLTAASALSGVAGRSGRARSSLQQNIGSFQAEGQRSRARAFAGGLTGLDYLFGDD